MKTTIAILLAALFPALAMAAGEHGAHGAMPAHTSAPDAKMVDGQVKKVDKAAGKVTLAHGPLANLGMDMPMTMVFRVKDAAWLDQMKEGDKIRFVADNVNGAITVVRFEKAQ
ncbi:copper-binding protein [Propionivibrio sp.]|uniref:copper-binding protein n=1 Tax=Propionivibrio sp. TaxID=2212460 RepID=UPI0039E5D918